MEHPQAWTRRGKGNLEVRLGGLQWPDSGAEPGARKEAGQSRGEKRKRGILDPKGRHFSYNQVYAKPSHCY